MKQTPLNVGKSDMKPGQGGTYMDMEEGGEGAASGEIQKWTISKSSQYNYNGLNCAGDEEGEKEGEDVITEQTHHIIVPSYSAW